MSSHLFRRWLLAIVMIVGVAAIGAGSSLPSAPVQAAGDTGSAATMTTASGWHGIEGITPVQRRLSVTSDHQRGGQLKVLLLPGSTSDAAFAVALARRATLRRPSGSPRPLALRARSLPRRAPPILPLG